MIGKVINNLKVFLEDRVFACFSLFAVCLFVYRNMLQNGFLIDDYTWIVYWKQLSSGFSFLELFMMPLPSELEGIIFLPFRNILHAINASAFGINPFGHHLFSLMMHFIASLLVYQISFKLTSKSFVAFLAALLFVVHPFQTSLVSFASGGVEIVGICFVLLSFLFFMRSCDDAKKIKMGAYGLTLVMFFLALGSYQGAVAFPFVLLWFSILFKKNCVLHKKGLLLWPFFLMSFLFMGIRFFVLNLFSGISLLGNSLLLTFYVMLKALAKYFVFFFSTLDVSLNHEISKGIFAFAPNDFDRISVLSQSIFDVSMLLSLFAIAAVGCFIFIYRKRNAMFSFCFAWMLLFLVPFLFGGRGFVFFAQKYGYLSLMGFVILISLGLDHLSNIKTEKDASFGKKGLVVILCIVLFSYSLSVVQRNSLLKDEVSVLSSDLKHVGNSRLSQVALVEAKIEHGDFKGAQKQVVCLNDRYANDVPILFLRGKLLMAQRKDAMAIAVFEAVLKRDPFFGDAYYRLARIYQKWGDKTLAMQFLHKAYYAYSKSEDVGQLEQFVDQFLSHYQKLK